MKKYIDKEINEYPWQYLLRISPRLTKDDVEDIKEINKWDLMFIFKNGDRFIYDTLTGYHRKIFYDDVNELTEEQEKREFARKLRTIMSRKWITQEELANRTGTSQTMISHYMTGRCLPNVITLRKIAKILNCSMDDFFFDDYNKYLKED